MHIVKAHERSGMFKVLMRFGPLTLLMIPGFVIAATPAATEKVTHTSLSGSKVTATRLYNAIVSLPVADRKVVFLGLSPDMKAAVWQEHLDNFKSTHVLSPAQLQLLIAVQNFATAELFATQKNDPLWEAQVHTPLKLLEDSARNAFPPDVLAAAFAQLGPDDTAVSVSSVSRAAGLRTSGPMAQMVSDCTCSVASDQCWFSTCGGSICYRSDGDYGCGFMWRYQCDAKCERNP